MAVACQAGQRHNGRVNTKAHAAHAATHAHTGSTCAHACATSICHTQASTLGCCESMAQTYHSNTLTQPRCWKRTDTDDNRPQRIRMMQQSAHKQHPAPHSAQGEACVQWKEDWQRASCPPASPTLLGSSCSRRICCSCLLRPAGLLSTTLQR